MRITVVAAGSQGDIQPYLALAVGLKAEGYKVRFVANSNFANFVASYNLDFYPIQVDSLKVAQSPQGQAWFESDSVLKLLVTTNRVLRPVVHQILVDIWDACQQSDVIIYHSFALPYVYFIGKQLDIPCIPASIDPLTTRAHPALALNVNWSRSKAFNLFTHWLVDHFAWRMFLPVVRKTWKGKINISALNPYKQILKEGRLVLCGYSPEVVPRPADLPGHVAITGYWFLDLDPNWQPDPELVRFIQSGQPPIYVGFGSMGNPNNKQATANIVLKALAETGQRAVLGAGWSDLGIGQGLPNDVFLLKSIPHSWLFPQMAVNIHHAGPGTTAAALSAGVPNVVIPHFASQYFYANRVAQLGVGPKPIDRKKLSTEELTRAISTATTDRGMQERASTLGAQIRAEQGINQAVQAMRNYINK